MNPLEPPPTKPTSSVNTTTLINYIFTSEQRGLGASEVSHSRRDEEGLANSMDAEKQSET